MAPFLKKHRDSFIKSNQMKNYLKYAVGEIVLVVIGILIALLIKGEYTKFEQDEHINKTAIQIIQDLRRDTAMIGQIVRFTEPLEEHYLAILSDTLSLEYLKSCERCPYLISTIQPFSPIQEGYQILQNIDSEFKSSKDSLINETKQFYSLSIPTLKLLVKLLEDDVSGNLEDWSDNKAWFSSWINGEKTQELYDYMLNDPFFKNKVGNHYLL